MHGSMVMHLTDNHLLKKSGSNHGQGCILKGRVGLFFIIKSLLILIKWDDSLTQIIRDTGVYWNLAFAIQAEI